MMTVLIALIGLAVFASGVTRAVAFGTAAAGLARLRAMGAYMTVSRSGVVKAGEAVVDRSVEAMPNALLRRLVRRAPPEGSAPAGSFFGLREDRRRTGKGAAVPGAAVVAPSFIAGPRLQNLIAGG